jgi:hypothetical protein
LLKGERDVNMLKMYVPDGFVGDDNVVPFLWREPSSNGVQLPCYDIQGLSAFSFL